MSFSSDVKKEICNFLKVSKHCNMAEIVAFINMCGHIIAKHDTINIRFQTENLYIARRIFSLFKSVFEINCEVKSSRHSNIIYILMIKNKADIKKILSITSVSIHKDNIDKTLIKKVCCKRSYIRAAFLASGSLTNPEKAYHLEFINPNYKHSVKLQQLINYFELEAKIIERKGHFIVYLKEGEQIVDLLNIIGAHTSLLKLENLRVLKDMRNNVNRIVNCETANLGKTIYASVNQLEDINYIQNTIGLDSLPELLKDIAIKRIKFPEASLKELGEKLSPKVGKSGVNHRLKKIKNIAEALKKNQEVYYV